MTTRTITYTHKGWFGVCPVHYANLHTEAPIVEPRHWLFDPLMWVSELVFGLVFLALDVAGRDNPGWPLKVTGSLTPPRVEVVDVDPEAD